MPDVHFVQPLSGSEIVEDFIDQIRKKLKGSCNLRANDAYPRGYSGKFNFHLELYGLDSPVEEGEVVVGTVQHDTPVTVVEGDSEIEVEPELDAVRQRSEQAEPVLARTADGGEEVRPRRYARRVVAPQGPVEAPVAGAAEEFVE